LEISDSAGGIPLEYLEPGQYEYQGIRYAKIFDYGFSKRKGGTGIGLAEAFFVITDHGGVIQIQNKLGEGATFIVKLPLIIQRSLDDHDISSSSLASSGVVLKEELQPPIQKVMIVGNALVKQLKLLPGAGMDVTPIDLFVTGTYNMLYPYNRLYKVNNGVSPIALSSSAIKMSGMPYKVDVFSDNPQTPLDTLLRKEQVREIINALLRSEELKGIKKPFDDFEMVCMHFSAMSFAAIGRSFNISGTTVAKRVRRMLVPLKKLLFQAEFEYLGLKDAGLFPKRLYGESINQSACCSGVSSPAASPLEGVADLSRPKIRREQ
jgi:hypothetical protein